MNRFMRKIILIIALSLFPIWALAESERLLSLDEAIFLARTKSVDAAVAVNELRSAY